MVVSVDVSSGIFNVKSDGGVFSSSHYTNFVFVDDFRNFLLSNLIVDFFALNESIDSKGWIHSDQQEIIVSCIALKESLDLFLEEILGELSDNERIEELEKEIASLLS